MSRRSAKGAASRLDARLLTRQFMLDATRLGGVQDVLLERAPEWSREVRLVYDERKKTTSPPIDLRRPGALLEALDAEARRPPSELTRQLHARFGRPAHDRLIKSFQLAGAHDALLVLLYADEYPFAPVLSEWHWGNGLTVQITGDTVEGAGSAVWSTRLLEQLARRLGPDYGYACAKDQYWEKNISTAGGARAVGLDVSKALPGLYWLNFFGRPYVDLIGRQRLLEAPGSMVREVDDGVLLQVDPEPAAWQTQAYRERERRILAHVGPEYFFSKDEPARRTLAPDFSFPPRP